MLHHHGVMAIHHGYAHHGYAYPRGDVYPLWRRISTIETPRLGVCTYAERMGLGFMELFCEKSLYQSQLQFVLQGFPAGHFGIKEFVESRSMIIVKHMA